MLKQLCTAIICMLLLIACQKERRIPVDDTQDQEQFQFCRIIGEEYSNIAPDQPRTNAGPPCVLLKFHGFNLPAGTGWNGGNPKYIAPSGLPADSITRIINKVRDDFAPFNIIIDTVDAYWESAPTNRRTIMIFTTDTTVAPIPAAAIASQNAFVLGATSINWLVGGFIFTHNPPLSLQTTDFRAFACSHETGHTMNLRHSVSCDPVLGMNHIGPSGYFTEHSAVSYIPIMNGYFAAAKISNWVIAPDDQTCPNNLGMVNQYLELDTLLGLKPDDAGPDLATATNFSYGKIGRMKFGVLGQGDVDTWRFTPVLTEYPNITVSIEPMYVQTDLATWLMQPYYANVDLKVEVYNDLGVLQSTIDVPEDAASSDIPIGRNWYLRISATSNNPWMNPLYMTGNYQIRKSF